MNEREFLDRLADYLAGELDAAQAESFRAEIADDVRRRRLVDELQAAAAALECRALSDEQARDATAELRWSDVATRNVAASASRSIIAPAAHRRFHAVGVALRYAAVIALAFVSGYWTRGGAENRPNDAAPAALVSEAGPVRTDAKDLYAAHYVKAGQSFPNASSFSRTIMALARNAR